MSHDIDPADAKAFISNYQKANGNISAYCFKRDKLDKILGQKNCEGLRIYYALKKNGDSYENALILVGIDANKKDINSDLSEFVAEYGIYDVDIGSPLV